MSFVICHLWEVLPYDVGFNSICISNFATSFGQKRGYCRAVNIVKKIQIQLINYKKTTRGQYVDLTVLTNFNLFLCCKFILKMLIIVEISTEGISKKLGIK